MTSSGASRARSRADVVTRPPLPLEERDVASHDGTRLRCWRVGRGAPLLVSNPFTLHPRLWLPLAREIDGRFSLVLWQSRGMWDSGAPGSPSAVSVRDLARDAEAVARAMTADECGLIGYCAGALPLCDALERGALSASRVMFIGALLEPTSAELTLARFLARMRERPRGREAVRSIVLEFAPPELREHHAAALADEARLEMFVTGFIGWLAYRAPPLVRASARLCLAVAQGDRDEVKLSNRRYALARQSEDDRLVEVPGPHHFWMTQPGVAAAVIDEFFGVRDEAHMG